MAELDLDLVRCFLTVAERRSFTAAGATLGRTQSAISMRIQKLEEALGERLLTRTSRTVALTARGDAFSPYAKRLLALNDETFTAFTDEAAPTALRIGVVEYLAPDRLPRLLADLRDRLPPDALSVRLGLSRDLLAAFDAGALDVVVAQQDDGRPGHLPLFAEPLLWTCAKTAAPTLGAPNLPLCLMPAPYAYRAAALDSLAKLGASWRAAAVATSIHGLQAAVQGGLGCAVLGRSSIRAGMMDLTHAAGWPRPQALAIAAYGATDRNRAALGPFFDALRSAALFADPA